MEQYYPFGLAIKPLDKEGKPDHRFTYNGKELEEETGYLDYHARQHDPQLGRFMSVDPLAEKFHSFSSYIYVADNPINFIDPDGREWKVGFQLKEDGSVHISLKFTGAVIDETGKHAGKMKDYKDRIISSLKEAFSGSGTTEEGTNVSWDIEVDLRVVKSEKK